MASLSRPEKRKELSSEPGHEASSNPSLSPEVLAQMRALGLHDSEGKRIDREMASKVAADRQAAAMQSFGFSPQPSESANVPNGTGHLYLRPEDIGHFSRGQPEGLGWIDGFEGDANTRGSGKSSWSPLAFHR